MDNTADFTASRLAFPPFCTKADGEPQSAQTQAFDAVEHFPNPVRTAIIAGFAIYPK